MRSEPIEPQHEAERDARTELAPQHTTEVHEAKHRMLQQRAAAERPAELWRVPERHGRRASRSRTAAKPRLNHRVRFTRTGPPPPWPDRPCGAPNIGLSTKTNSPETRE